MKIDPFACRRIARHLRNHPIEAPLPETMARHLAACPRCREAWRRQQSVEDRLSLFSRSVVPDPGADSYENLRLALQAHAGERSKPHPGLRSVRPFAVAALLAGIGLALPLSSGFRKDGPRNGRAEGPAVRWKRQPEAPNVEIRNAPRFAGAASSDRSRFDPPFRSAASLPANGSARTAPPSFRPARPPVYASAGDAHPTPRRDDLAYLNAPPPETLNSSAFREAERTLRRGDDFVTVPYPRLADADASPASLRLIDNAIRSYEQEKAITDERLFRKVDTEMKGGDLKELADLLTRKTGVRFYVSPDLADLKLSVFVKDLPARDLMRQIVRLFNLEWRRRGEEGRYTYELIQTLKQKLAEEELQRQDTDQMLLNVVDEMEPYLQYKDTPPDQIKALAEEAETQASVAGSVEERQRLEKRQLLLEKLTNPRYRDVLKLYSLLTPDQLVALRNGQDVLFTSKGDGSESSLPKEMADRLLDTYKKDDGFGEMLKDADPGDVTLRMGFTLQKEQPDHVSLAPRWDLDVKHGKSESRTVVTDTLTEGQPDRLRSPDNEQSHAAYRSRPEFAPKTSLTPDSSVPAENAKNPNAQEWIERLKKEATGVTIPPDGKDWIDSADFFAALHRRTGRNVIADYYTRVYPKSRFSVSGKSLLDVLNDAADALQSDWQEDGGFLRFRRFNYYTERTLDVPNRLLRKWRDSRDQRGYLSLDDLSEVAALSDVVRGNDPLRQAVLLKYGLDEWTLASGAKQLLSFYAKLPPAQKQALESDQGLPLSEVGPDALAEARKAIGGENMPEERIRAIRCFIQYKKPGSYAWIDSAAEKPSDFPLRPVAEEKDREKALAAAESYLKNHGATPQQIERRKRDLLGPGAAIWMDGFAPKGFFISWSGGGGMSLTNGSFPGQSENPDRNVTQTSRD
jgi:hypothetical protein